MKKLLVTLVLGTMLAACNNGGGGGGGGTTPAPANPSNPNGGDDGRGGGGNDDLGEPGGTEISCLLYESSTQTYWIGFGDSNTAAAELATEVCRNFTKLPVAACSNVVACEQRITADTWRCTAVNSVDGYVTTSKGRSKLEAFNQAHGFCSKGLNASPATCTKFEQAVCVNQAE